MKTPIVFGTDGWRGIIDEEVNDATIGEISRALVSYLDTITAPGPVAIGYDGRTNSAHFADVAAEAVAACGREALLSDRIVPTPVLSFATRSQHCAAGLMVTASHNPPEYNGVKFKGPYGGPFMSEATREVSAHLGASPSSRSGARGAIRKSDILSSYLAHIESLVDTAALRKAASDPARQPSVMIDSMGGAGQTILEDMLVRFGWRGQTIFGAPEPRFYERSPEPIEKNLGPLLYNVRVTDAVAGLATDGDADRCSAVFDDGTWLNAQEIILAMLWHLHHQKAWRGRIIKTASVTDKVRLLAQQWGEEVIETDVGFKYVAEEMLKGECLFGGEESGGFGYGKHLPERDGILSGLFVIEMIARSGKSLREIVDGIRREVGDLYYSRIDAPYNRPDRSTLLARLAQGRTVPSFAVGTPELATFGDGDRPTGIKYRFGDCRWLLLRTSQTEPLVRLYAEGRSADEVLTLLAEGKVLLGI